MSKIKIKQNAFDGLNYNESVNLYFEKKGEYEIQKENKMKELLPQKIDPSTKKKKFDNTKFNCSNCDRPVDMIFKQNETKFTIGCGDTKTPCNINKSFSKKKEISLNDLAKIYLDNMENLKENIILTKLDLLFEYETEELSSANFKTLLADLKEDQEAYSNLYKQFAKKNLMVEKKNGDGVTMLMTRDTAIQEYKDELKKNINKFKNTIKNYYNPNTTDDKNLKSIIQFYNTDINPILTNLRKCLYQETDIISVDNNLGKIPLPPVYYIKNYHISPSNMTVPI